MKREHIQAEAAEWIVTLNDPAATEADFAGWQAWMNRDPAHAEAFQRLQETWRRAGAVSHAPMPAARSGNRWAVAAVAVFGVIGAAIVVWQSQSPTIATATAEMRSMQLEDGSRVSLGPETRMEVHFSDRERSLQLTGGEAYFEVAHAPERPFSVTTPAGTVTAIGTAFVVNADPERLIVSVTEGTVRVDLPDASTERAPMMVAAGRKLAWNEGKVRTSQLADNAGEVNFQQGKLHYDGEPLSSVIADINRYSTSKLRIEDPAVRDMRYTGTVFTDSLEVWLSSLPGVFPVRIEERDGERVLVASN